MVYILLSALMAPEQVCDPRVGHGLDSSTDWIGLDWVRWRKIGL